MNDQVFDTLYYATLYFAHMDEANAAIHCAPVKFSPITFRMYDVLQMTASDAKEQNRLRDSITLTKVAEHVGTYELDGGR